MKGSASEFQEGVPEFEETESEFQEGNSEFQENYAEFDENVYDEIQKVPNFSLTEIHSLLVILENITLEILQQFENVRLEEIIDYYCNLVALACKKIKKVNTHFIFHLKIILKGYWCV